MNTEDLAQMVVITGNHAAERVRTVGRQQYEAIVDDVPVQRAETMSTADLFEEIDAELLDIVSWATFIRLRLQRIQSDLEGRRRAESDDPEPH